MARKFQGTTTSSGKTILLVDDNVDYLEATRLILEREGHRVLTAETGPIALKLVRDQPIDLMLLDYYMPGMTGAQIVEELRKFNPYLQVILQTGYASENPPREMLRRLDIQGYHDKSEGPDKLLLWADVGLNAAYAVQVLAKGRLGLNYILSAAPELYRIQPLEDLLNDIFCQVSGLLDIADSSLAVVPPAKKDDIPEGFVALVDGDDAQLRIRAGLGRFGELDAVTEALEPAIGEILDSTIQKGIIHASDGRIIVPLRIGSRLIGVIYLEREIRNPSEVELLGVFACQAAAAIQNSQLYAMATVDTLTGVFVRRFFNQWVVRELKSALRSQKPLGFLMLDLDNMKGINDSFGHLAGDAALVRFSAALKSAIRSSDFIGRYGGDEFSILLPNSSVDGIELVVRRLLEGIRSSRMTYGDVDIDLKACIGIAILMPSEIDVAINLPRDYYRNLVMYLQKAADESLCEAKRAGRDRAGIPKVVSWPNPEDIPSAETFRDEC